MAENITASRVSAASEQIRSVREMELVRLAGFAGVAADGTVIFTDNPVDEDTLTVNGVVINFLDTVVDPATDVEIGLTAAATLANLLAYLVASEDALLTVADYESNEIDILTITYGTVGTGGNAFTLATDSVALALSDETLTGGLAVTAAGDTSTAYVSGMRAPSFCVGGATVASVSGQSVVFKALAALEDNEAVVRLYSAI